MNSQRADIVRAAFVHIVERAEKEGAVTIDDNGAPHVALFWLVQNYDAARHPRVADGSVGVALAKRSFVKHVVTIVDYGKTSAYGVKQPSAEVVEAVLQSDPAEARHVTFDHFYQFYERVSEEVDKGREIEKEPFFELIVTRTWSMDTPETFHAPGSSLRMTTLETPKGIASTKNMDIVWDDPDRPGHLLGYKAMVKPVFARGELPEAIRSHFALQVETEATPHTYLKVQPPLLAPLDLVWVTDDGRTVGYQGIVMSNVEREELPEALKAVIVPNSESKKRGTQFMDFTTVANPSYKRVNQEYGNTASFAAKALQQSRVEGNELYVGKAGEFTRQFPGPYRNSGLNVTRIQYD